MPVVLTTAYAQAEDALTLARALVNDTAGVVFTDSLLMPLLNSAYRGLQRELAENGVSVLVEQQDIELDVNSSTGATNTELSDVSSPQLPTDCLMPHMLWERVAANTGDVFGPRLCRYGIQRPSGLGDEHRWRPFRIRLRAVLHHSGGRVRPRVHGEHRRVRVFLRRRQWKARVGDPHRGIRLRLGGGGRPQRRRADRIRRLL